MLGKIFLQHEQKYLKYFAFVFNSHLFQYYVKTKNYEHNYKLHEHIELF